MVTLEVSSAPESRVTSAWPGTDWCEAANPSTGRESAATQTGSVLRM